LWATDWASPVSVNSITEGELSSRDLTLDEDEVRVSGGRKGVSLRRRRGRGRKSSSIRSCTSRGRPRYRGHKWSFCWVTNVRPLIPLRRTPAGGGLMRGSARASCEEVPRCGAIRRRGGTLTEGELKGRSEGIGRDSGGGARIKLPRCWM